MNKKTLYELFIGLLALMLSIMLILDLMYILPIIVVESFYCINLIVSVVFLLDYIISFMISNKNTKFIVNNIIDLISSIPFIFIGELITNSNLIWFININTQFKIAKLIILLILIIKFKNKIKGTVKRNKFNYLLIVTTIIIVLGAVTIALLEDMTFGDAIWWSFVTFTTIGYGDVLITTTLGRLTAVLLMIFGIGFIGVTISSITAYIINSGDRGYKGNFRNETINFIKYKIDNLDSLSDSELDSIYKTLKTLRESKKSK